MTVLGIIMEWMETQPKGVLSREVAEALSLGTASYASKYLDRGVMRGLVCKVAEGRADKDGGGRTMRYFLPHQAEAAVRENSKQVANRAKKTLENKRKRERESQARRRRPADTPPGDRDYYVHRVVSAEGTIRPKAGPRWVFDLAQSS